MSESTHILRNFVADLLEFEGALVEPVEPEGLEFLAPPEVQRALNVPESGRFGFGPELPAGAQRIGFESDRLERFGQVLGERGRLTSCALAVPLPTPSSPERMLEHGVSFNNAVHRLVKVFPAWTRYLALVFHYTAMSDEKRDGLLTFAVNLATKSVIDDGAGDLLASPVRYSDLVGPLPPGTSLPLLWSPAEFAGLFERGLPERVRRDSSPFLGSLQRRLERDSARIHDYYEGLRRESFKRLHKTGADTERERLRIDAVEREYAAKVNDLRQKYAMRIDIEWIQTLDLALPVQRFDLLVKRRKGERRIFLDWNPLLKKLDPLPCEYSFTFESKRTVCDDTLHIVSLAAHGPCEKCGKEYCRACHVRKCPKCGNQP